MPVEGKQRPSAQTQQALFTKLQWIAEKAKEDRSFQFQNLAHLINPQMLELAFRNLRKDAASGIDDVSARAYEENLGENLLELHERLKQRRYRAQPLRRIYIEKEDGSQRALSIPTTEDKIVQRAVVTILNRIYENDFLSCSYGYRPKRSAHDALKAIRETIVLGKTSYVVDADIQDYFGSLVRDKLREMLCKRITDKDIMRLIGKWLKVGVLDEGRMLLSEDGTYQGSVISPLLANIYLHEVLDKWVEDTVKPRMRGEIALFRFADDFIVCFQYRDDAERFYRVLPKRFEKFGLKLHPKKTKLIAFGRFAESEAKRSGTKPSTFCFLGFTFIGGKTRIGKYTIKVRTMSKRLARALKRVSQWCRQNRHEPVWRQHQHLSAVLRGHDNYYGQRTNSDSIRTFHYKVENAWKKWLGKRGDQYFSWGRFVGIRRRYPLPAPRLLAGQRMTQTSLNL